MLNAAGLAAFKAAIAREDQSQQIPWLEFCSAERLLSSLFFFLVYHEAFLQSSYFIPLLEIKRSKKNYIIFQ